MANPFSQRASEAHAHRAFEEGLDGRRPRAEYTDADHEDWIDGDYERYLRNRDE